MKILNAVKSMNPDTFEPVVEITMQLPLEAVVDARALMGKMEQAKMIGIEFLNAYEEYCSNQ
jgi:hypothetical protein